MEFSSGPSAQSRFTRKMAVAGLILAAGVIPLAAAGPAAAAEETIKVVTYNVGDAGGLKGDLKNLIDAEQRPAVIGLQEVADRVDILREVADETDYRLVLEADGESRRHNAILVRANMTLLDHGLREISPRTRVHEDTPGTGGTGWVPPKYVNWARVRGAGFEWVVGVVHLVPSASLYQSNEALHRLEVGNVRDWFESRVAEPIVMGDFNAEPDSSLMNQLRGVAKPFSARTFPAPNPTRSIDHVWAKRNATGSEIAALNGYGSDHRPLRVRVTVTR